MKGQRVIDPNISFNELLELLLSEDEEVAKEATQFLAGELSEPLIQEIIQNET